MYCRNVLRKLCYWSTDSLLFFILKKCVSLLRLFRSIYFTLSRNALRDELERTCLSCRGDLWVLHENETGPLERTLELTNKFKLSTLDSKATPPIKAFRPFIWPTVIFPFFFFFSPQASVCPPYFEASITASTWRSCFRIWTQSLSIKSVAGLWGVGTQRLTVGQHRHSTVTAMAVAITEWISLF